MLNEKDGARAWDTGVIERELVLSRVIDAPRQLVFSVWSDPEHLTRWFSPEGFKSETHEIDLRVGGRWRFTYVGSDGKRYDNRITFLQIESPCLLEFDHGPDKDDAPDRFRVLVTFDEQSDGKTVLTFRQLHPTKARRDSVLAFGAVEIGYGTLAKLDHYVSTLRRPDSRKQV
ncbi:MAG: SRPBCC domain-containing protein [Alphaproteobacteria bacterium]|nr:SRPBCC domain-containing protein [Alphaproteobacteria bacterium]